jgi:murein DD-endopeptidase MepM/ murein hydrolase activator NlpD
MGLRLATALILAVILGACQGQRAATPPPASPPPTTLATQPTAETIVPSPTARATDTPTQAPTATARPTEAPMPTKPAIQASTATALPGQTPSRSAAPQAQQHYFFPVHSTGKISYGRFHHDYPAADIFCPVGSQFLAVTDGVVDFVSSQDTWDPTVNDGATRGGLSVAIVGDDGVRYYGSHLSQVAEGIEPGVRVTAGQQLGLTGKSGDARNTSPHLHFGISHPTTPDDWQVRRGEVPPYEYLQAWQRGEDVTPVLP